MEDGCPACHGAGFEIQTDERGVVRAARCSCEFRDREQRLYRRARIPRRYDHCALQEADGLKAYNVHHPSQGTALRRTREWVEAWPAVRQGLLFVGPPGTGKTHLVVALARELIRHKGARVLFYEQRELLKALQGTYDQGAPQREAEVLDPVRDAEVLILDDVGAGRTTPWAQEVIHDIIVQRYNEERPLLMTSNHPTGDEPERARKAGPVDGPLSLRDGLGDALMSRLYEMCRIIRLEGSPDYRREILETQRGG